MKFLNKTDSAVLKILKDELKRQKQGLIMIPSENFTSPAVLETMSSVLSNKYSEGYPGARYYTGNQYIDQIEQLAIDRAKKLFGAEHANVQPHAGSTANSAIYFALIKPGDKILSLDLTHGGHLSHGSKVTMVGKTYQIVHYGVNKKNEQVDLDEVQSIALKEKPKMIITGATAYPRQINFAGFQKIATKVGAIHLADISHIAGLIIAKQHPDAVSNADVVMTTTHKTLRGPRSAIIMCRTKYGSQIDKAIFPGTQGGPMEHIIAAKAVCFKEAMSQKFVQDQKQTVKNAKTLARVFMDNGLRLISNGTDTHLILIDCTNLDITGKQAATALAECGIYTNFNTIPFETRSPFNPSGLRLGTPALTTQGMKEKEMELIGQMISRVLKNPTDLKIKKEAKNLVTDLTTNFQIYKDLNY